MKVFMSWSGARSKAAAELLYNWVKCVVQASRPWISTRGIGRGAVWFSEINNELKDTSVGIICLTHENKNAPWILFEAGALAKGLTTNKVCTFLVDLGTSDIRDPLAQFNHTMPTKDGMMALAATLNSSLDSPLDTNTLTTVFDAFWPQFEADFKAMLDAIPQEGKVEEQNETTMLEAILESTRGLSQRIRAIEEQQTVRLVHTPSAAWPFPVKDEDEKLPTPSRSLTIDAWLSSARGYADQGLTRHQTTVKFRRQFGPQRTAQIMSYVDKAFPPIVFAGDETPD